MLLPKFSLMGLILFIGLSKKISNDVAQNLKENFLLSDLQSDEFLDSSGFLEKYQYPSEKIRVVTEDGYMITLFRIPKNGPPVLLVHGFTDSSDEWLVLGPGRSLAYQLSDAGFDVWLFNFRGNRYSKGHAMNITEKEYWNFSYEEMGTHDVPAVIDHILNVTSQKKISYVGFSQGTTIFLVMCSMRPQYNDKIQVPILLAPVAWISHLKMPFKKLVGENVKFLELVANRLDLNELFPFNPNKAYYSINCHKRFSTDFCNIKYRFAYGLKDSRYLSPDKITVIDSHIPAGGSAKNVLHFIQGFESERFQRYDYGSKKNLEVYSSKRPPNYNVKLVTVPVNLIASETDWLSHYKDVRILARELPNVKRFIMYNKSLEFSHAEFVFGTRVNELVNHPVMNILLNDLNMRKP